MKDIIRRILEQEMGEAAKEIHTKEEIIKVACQYDNRRDFRNNHKYLDRKASKKGWVDDIMTACNYKLLGNLYSRLLYMYVWNREDFAAVYFGLTCDESRRFGEHTTEFDELDDVDTAPNCKVGSSSVNKFIKENGVYDTYQALSDGYIQAEHAAYYEKCLIAKFREEAKLPEWDPELGNRKLIVVNKSKGGELGFCRTDGRPVLKDAQEILDKQIKNPEELSKMLPDVSNWWSGSPKRKQILNYQLKKRFFDDVPYDDREIFDVAYNFETRDEFEKFNPEIIKAAKRKRMIDILFPKDFVYYNKNNGEYYTNLKSLTPNFKNFKELFYKIRRKQENSIGIFLVPKEEYERKKSEENKIVESVLKRISYK